ncbi:homing endonuclease [Escherichia phage BEK12B]|nr:homing endonuclease [Escherichia phage BEK7]QGH77153.1 homing endonuclease [Escherichia phage BEK1-23]QGH77467.1 homing endonuclease [Escherichia phage BEK12B]QGH77576.1 homing endonuclease [Escherichia phage BEC3]
MNWHDIFSYDNGRLFWATKRANCIKVGDEAGFLHHQGYRFVCINGKQFAIHRIVWEMHYGKIPYGYEIDHINGIRDDNRIENLRLVMRIDNMKNKATYRNNKSGFAGVSWDKSKSRWVAKIANKKLGDFKSIIDAVNARIVAEVSSGFHKNHGRKQ